MLLVSQSGNNVNITTLGTKTDISVTGSVANIMVEGYTWNVNAVSGTFSPLTIADLEMYPLLSGGSCNIGVAYYGNVAYSFEPGQTMKNVTSLDATLIFASGRARAYYTPLGEMSFDHVFVADRNDLGNDYIRRINTDDLIEEVYEPDGLETGITYLSLMYNDCTAYDIEHDVASEDYLIRKIVFNGSGATPTTVYTVSSSVAYEGYTYTIYDVYYFNRLKYGTTDCIIMIASYHNDTYGEIFRCVVYHPNSNTSHSQMFDCGFHADCSLHYASSPSIYQNNFVFTINPSGYALDVEPDPIPPTCYCPTYILDVNDHSITMVNDYLTDVEAGEYIFVFGGSGIDSASSEYYFSGDTDVDYQLFNMNLITPSITSSNATNMHLFQGANEVYGVDRTPAPGACSVRSIPSLNVLTTVDIYIEHGADYFEGACIIDQCHDMIWNIKANELEGKALNMSATSRDIPIAWPGGGDVLFAYANNRELFIRILAGRVLVLVYSSGFEEYQSDWYLLRECLT